MTYKWDINIHYGTKGGKYKTEKQMSFVNKYLPKKKINILDIGGGSGRFAIPLEKIGHNLTVIEPNKNALDILESRNNNIILINEKFEDYKSKDCFDMVIAIELIEYISDLNTFLKKVYNLLNDNSFFIFTSPNNKSLKFLVRKLFPYNKYFYTHGVKKYRQLLKDNLFEVIDIEGYNWIPFRTNSNSQFVPLFATIENILQLGKWVSQSPEILYCSNKN